VSELCASRRLNVSSTNPDRALQRVQDRVDGEACVSGRIELEQLLAGLLDCSTRIEGRSLDLFAHSAGKARSLILGGWTVSVDDPGLQAFAQMKATLKAIGVNRLRLIGCGTATTPGGQKTMSFLASALDLPVFGAITDEIFQQDFDASGFIADRKLRDHTSAPRARPEAFSWPRGEAIGPMRFDALQGELVRPARPAPWPRMFSDLERSRTLFDHLDAENGRSLPGLLTQPIAEILVPAEADGLVHRIEILLDWQLVRVYPVGNPDGAVYRIRRPHQLAGLAGALEQV